MSMNDRYLTHKEKLEMFSAAEIMTALNDFFSNPDWRNEKRFIIRSEFSIGFKRADMAADWAIDSAIRYLREEFGIFYAPDAINMHKDDEYCKQGIKCTNDIYKNEFNTNTIYKTEFDHHSVKAIIVALNRWFGSEGKLPVKYFDAFIGYSDFCIDEPYVDTRAHLDGCQSHYYNGSTWDSNVDCPDRPKNAAYAAIEYLREEHGIFYSPQMEPDNSHKTKGELELEKKNKSRIYYLESRVQYLNKEVMEKDKAARKQLKDDMDYILNAFREILDALGIDKSNYVHMDIPSLTRFVIMEAEKAASNPVTEKCKLIALEDKILSIHKQIFEHDQNAKWACACTPYRKLEFIENYISELRTHNESLRIRCDSVFGPGGFVTKAKINDLCDEYSIVRPRDDEDCEESLRYILDILKEYRVRCTRSEDKVVRLLKDMTKNANDKDEKVQEMSRAAAYVDTCIIDLYKRVFNSTPQNMFTDEMLKRIGYAYENSLDRGRGAGQTYKLICDICDKYEIKKPSSDMTIEECIDDILKRFKMTLKENQDFRYEVEKLYVNMTDLQPSYRMTILDILRAIAEDVDDREEAYCDMEAKWDTAEKLRKDWVRRYESEHERANGEHKKADKYWAQVAGLQTRIKNLEDALNRSASNATGYEALKNTLRKTLDSEARLKFERDSLAEELKKAKDAIRKQNEAILRKERLDEASDCDTED